MSERPRLVRPSPELEGAVLDLARETREGGDDRYRSAERDYSAWLARLDEVARGEKLKPNRVPYLWFCLLKDGRSLGGSRLRLELNEGLLAEGGHVGYEIRPSERGRGYGTLILALTLGEAAARGIDRVRVTCDDDNLRSRKVIERNGGRLDGRSISDESGKLVRQYWIELPEGAGRGAPPDSEH